jgi:hypothetical protein
VTFKRRAIHRIVVTKGGPAKRKGYRFPWVAVAYDTNGDLRSRVNGDQKYVEEKIKEWWPDVPVEYKERET